MPGRGEEDKAEASVVKKQKTEDEDEALGNEDVVKENVEQVAVKDEKVKEESGESGDEDVKA